MRFRTVLLGLLAFTSLVLAMVGIYGVMSYAVAQSNRELGLRMALGAGSAHVLRLVVGEGMWAALIGMAIGLPEFTWLGKH